MNYISSTENASLMANARESLKGKWSLAICTWIVFMVLTNIWPELTLWEKKADWCGDYKINLDIIWLIINGPMALGFIGVMLSLSRNQDPKFAELFNGFKRFGVALGTFLLMLLFIILWSLLLIVPGIIAYFRYSQTWFILVENENMSPLEAIRKSKEMMIGNKWKLFCLYWRFFGWFLLCLLTLGIGFLFLGPYMSVSMAKFYEDLKGQEIANESDVSADTTPGGNVSLEPPTIEQSDDNGLEEKGGNS